MKNINFYYGYIPRNTIDANLHPDKQIEVLHKLIEESTTDEIEICCNSPYVLNEIMLIEGYTHNKVRHPKGFEITARHFECLFDVLDGSPIEGKYYKTMISDENLLNDRLGDANDKYDDLLALVNTEELFNQ